MYHDVLGIEERMAPKFVRRYAELGDASVEALAAFADDVRSGRFPSDAETYHLSAEVAESLSLYGAPACPEARPQVPGNASAGARVGIAGRANVVPTRDARPARAAADGRMHGHAGRRSRPPVARPPGGQRRPRPARRPGRLRR